MHFGDRHTALPRILIGSVAAFFMISSIVAFYQFGSTATDENLFTNPPCRLFMRNDLSPGGGYPGLLAGDLLCEVNGAKFDKPEEFAAILKSSAPEDTLTLTIFRPVKLSYAKIVLPRKIVHDSSFFWLTSGVYVISVEAGGASDRAGMKVGDMIVRINGKEFVNALEADRILRQGQTGRTILYEVLRGGERLDLHVTLARFGFPLAILIFSLSGFVYLAVGSMIALRKPQLKAARLIGIGFLLIGFFLSTVALRRDDELTFFLFGRALLLFPALYFGIALLWHSELYFPKELPGLLAKRWFLYAGYGLAGVFSTLSVLTYPLGILRVSPGGPLTLAGIAVLLVVVAVAKFASRKYRTQEYNRQRRAITVSGIAIAVVAGAAAVITAIIGTGNLPGLFAIVAFVLLPFAYLYTIGRYRLLDMNLRVRRNIQYTLLSIAWGGLVGLLFLGSLSLLLSLRLNLPGVLLRGGSVEFTDVPAGPGETNPLERFTIVIAAAAAWFVFWKVRRWGQSITDAKYFRTEYDYRRAARELAEMLATKLSMVDLGRGLVEKIVDLMKLKRGAVFFFKDESVCCCREAFGIDAGVWSCFCTGDENNLAPAVRQFEAPFSVDLLPPHLKEQFREQDFKFLVPIRSKDQLIGLLVLGEKLSETPFVSDDVEFLAAAASQASVSIENAFLYEELSEKERMKHELEIARRIQLASLPQRTPEVEGLDVAGRSVPALEVGGDFFDYLNGQEGHLTVVVGDVSGKGTSAALYMSKVQGILRSLHGFTSSLADLFIRTNRLLSDDMEKKSFITAVGARFDTRSQSLIFARAGHLPLYRFSSRTQAVERVTPRGLGLGLENAGLFAAELEERDLRYDTGDILLFVTDGIVEARNDEKEEFGEDRLVRILQDHAPSSAVQLRDRILNEVRSFEGDVAPHDDQTVVVVKAV